MDPIIIQQCKNYAAVNGSSFQMTDRFEDSIKGQDVVYAKAWAPTALFQPPVGEHDPKKAQAIFDSYKSWKTTTKLMDTAAKNAIYLHCLPADRGHEVESAVMDKIEGSGWLSAIYDEAENRLHGQKAVMSLIMK